MCNTDNLIKYLLEDTISQKIEWNCVSAFGSDLCSIDFRDINPVMQRWVEQNFFIGNSHNLYVAQISSGFIYIFHPRDYPDTYNLYCQADCHSKIERISIRSSLIKELYLLVSETVQNDSWTLDNFIEELIHSFWINPDDE